MTVYTYSLGNSTVEYHPETGIFTWFIAYRKPRLTGMRADRAGHNDYRYIKIGQKTLSASRLAWELVNGPIPDGLEIDHINRDNTDNRIANLRVVNRTQNLQNREFGPNRTGFTGVSLHKFGLYRARYRYQTKYFETAEEAAAAYQEMKAADSQVTLI
jgi:hypothetical protein